MTFYDNLQDALLDIVRQLPGQPSLTADQLHLARLPVTAGGLGLHHLPTLALIARTSCLATFPRAAHTDSFRLFFVRQEGDLLLERLRGLSEKHSAQMAGDLMDAPSGLSLRHLSRKLTRSIHSKAVSNLWKRRLPGKWQTTLLDPVVWVSAKELATLPRARANAVDVPPQGANNASTF